MQTVKGILSRAEERRHLKSGALCFLLVIVLVLLVFGIPKLDFGPSKDPVATEVTAEEPAQQ